MNNNCIKVKDIYNYIDSIAPFSTAMDFDNVGLLVGDINKPVNKILVSLDITDGAVEEAKKIGASGKQIAYKFFNNITETKKIVASIGF